MDAETLILLKKFYTLINFLVAFASFGAGISPLFMDKEKLSQARKPILVEISAMIFVIFTLSTLALEYFVDRPVFKNNNCIQLKSNYLADVEFSELKSPDLYRIIKTGKDNYLIKNLRNDNILSFPIRKDYQYKRSTCFQEEL